MMIAAGPGSRVAVGVGVTVGTRVGSVVGVPNRIRVGSGLDGNSARTFGATDTATAVGMVVVVGLRVTTAFFGGTFVGATVTTRGVGVTGGVNGWIQLTTESAMVSPIALEARRTPMIAPRTELMVLKDNRNE